MDAREAAIRNWEKRVEKMEDEKVQKAEERKKAL